MVSANRSLRHLRFWFLAHEDIVRFTDVLWVDGESGTQCCLWVGCLYASLLGYRFQL
jgi:hypothetical protein